MGADIHDRAIIDPGARLADGVTVGPCAIIEENVTAAPGVSIGAHAFVGNGVRLGTDVKIFPHAVVGTVPQDLKFGGEETTLEIGDRTVIREFATLNRGTHARGRTTVGSDCLLMSYSHVAHDCFVGDHCILANSATLAGHVTLGDWVIVGGLVPVHQFVRIGSHAMIGGGWRVPKDVPPYMTAAGDPLKPVTVNIIGLQRRGFSQEAVDHLKKAYRVLFRSQSNLGDALAELDTMGDMGPEVAHLKDFIRSSERGVIV